MRTKFDLNVGYLATAATISLLALAPAAQAVNIKTDRAYECSVNSNGFNGWVPSKIQFGFLEGDTRVKVKDPYTFHVKQKSIVTKLKSHANNKKSFRWQVELPSRAGHLVNVSYKVEFDPKTYKGKIFARVLASAGRRNSGSLTCTDYVMAKLDQAELNSNSTSKVVEESSKETEKARNDARWERYCGALFVFTQNRKFCNTYQKDD